MRCPKCGTTNGKTNNFCRGCGLKLEGLPVQEPQQPEASACTLDEVGLGEELFGIWQDYSAGNLDTALIRSERIMECAPDSASAHSILALIYERKAEKAASGGDTAAAHAFTKLAITEYERIIDLNPSSAADREKLASLRMRLAGQPAAVPQAKHIFDFRAAFAAVPKPVLIGAGTMLALLMVGIIVLVPAGRGERPRETAAPRGGGGSPAKVNMVSTTANPQASPSSPADGGSGGPKVYTFPQATPRGSGTALNAPRPSVSADDRLRIPQVPSKVPPLAGVQVSVVPEAKSEVKAEKTPMAPKEDRGEIYIGPAKSQGDSGSQAPDGATTLAQAIELHNQGKNAEAISAAQAAATQFQAEIDAGKSVTTARRGAENARKLIQLWQQ